jgi:hypothetical protein
VHEFGGWSHERVPTPAGPIFGMAAMLVVEGLAVWLATLAPSPTWMLACLPVAIAGLVVAVWIDHMLVGIALRDIPRRAAYRILAAVAAARGAA